MSETISKLKVFGLALWNRVCKTDPAFTKQTNNGRFSFTTVCPQYQLKQATELWGPYGLRWGLRDLKFTVISETSPIMMLEAMFYYPIEDEGWCEFPIAVDLALKPHDDVCKKLITSARSKALSWLGFNADIFLGQFDDAAYVRDVEIHFGKYEEFALEAMQKIQGCKTQKALDACRTRVNGMILEGTIPADIGSRLNTAIDDRSTIINQ